MGEYLGHALANIAAVLDPAIFVIGGGVSKAGDVLLPFIEKPFKDRAFFASQNVKILALATLGNDAGNLRCGKDGSGRLRADSRCIMISNK